LVLNSLLHRQMELNHRTARGRLSELFGELALDTDRTTRTFGFDRLGRVDWANMADDMRQIVLAHTVGVNAFLEGPACKLPIEFVLLRHQPEELMAFARVMLWQLSHAWYGEIVRAQMAEAVGAAHAAELDVQYPGTNPIALLAGIEFYCLDPDGSLHKATGPFLDRGKGSNAWAVAGNNVANRHTYLCNDMYLAVSLPGLWYANHLQAGEFHVAAPHVERVTITRHGPVISDKPGLVPNV